jgi:hypothetical protein
MKLIRENTEIKPEGYSSSLDYVLTHLPASLAGLEYLNKNIAWYKAPSDSLDREKTGNALF